MNISPVRIYINGNGSISFFGPNNTLITNLQNLNGAKQANGQIIFEGDDKTLSFYVYQLTAIESATFSLPYSALDSRFYNPAVYSAKLNEVYQDVAEYVLVNKNGGASFVGGVVAVYPNYASFPATGQEAVIYIDEGTNQAYFWDGTTYQLLVSTGVQQYANFASFPVTGSANVIYIDMSTFEPYVWDGAAYVSLTDTATVAWGSITGTLAAQTDLQAALDAKVPYTGATGNVNLGEYELKAGQLTLDTSPTGTATIGTTQWNDTIGSSQTTLKGGSVILKNGVDLVARIVNKVTPNTTLTKAAYQAVRVSGAQGQRLAVEFAQANNDNNSADTIGLITETIATNQEGFIMTVGNLEEINTTGSLQGETWADGDVLYLSPTTPGALTNIKPTGLTGHIVVMGYVEYSHAIHGKIYVKIMNGWELDELHNVYINGPTNGQILTFKTSLGNLWTNDNITTTMLPTGIPAANIGAGTVDNTEFAYLNGVTSSVQTQINNKQATLVSGTNIKTINGNSVLGSGDLVVSGNSGLVGVHNVNGFVPTAGNFGTDANLTGANVGASHLSVANQLLLYPYIPNKTRTIGSVSIAVGNLNPGVFARILIYSSNNGLPDSKLYESVNLDCSTNSQKSANTTFTFNAGTTYWLGYYTSAGGVLTNGINNAALLPLYMLGFSQPNYTMLTTTATFGSAPSTFSYTGGQANGVVPRIMLYTFPF